MVAITMKKSMALLKSMALMFKRLVLRDWAYVRVSAHMIEFGSADIFVGVRVTVHGLMLNQVLYAPLDVVQSALEIDSERFVVTYDHDLHFFMLNGVGFKNKTQSDTYFNGDLYFPHKAYGITVQLPHWDLINEVRMAEAVHDIRYYLNGTLFDLGNSAIVCTDGHRLHSANSTTLPAYTVEQLSVMTAQNQDESDGDYHARLRSTSSVIEIGQQ
jgi:hypothetical protein